MTEMTEPRIELPHAVQQFVLNWGTLGDRWGVNRSVSLIHALLYASERPLTADEIAATLEIARSNVSTSLRELQTWEIVRAVPVRGDRRLLGSGWIGGTALDLVSGDADAEANG